MSLRIAIPLTLALGLAVALGCATDESARTSIHAPVATGASVGATAPAAVSGTATATATGGATATATAAGTALASAEPEAQIRRLIDAHIEFLGSDDLGGRETGTVQSLVTAQYIAAAFRAAGLQPGGEQGSWFQSYPMESNRVVMDEARLVLHANGGEATLELFDDYLLGGYGGEGFALQGEAVFANYGIVDADSKTDDYAGLDPQGRFVVVLDGRPADRPELRRAGTSRGKRMTAKEHGAAGLIVLTDSEGRDSAQLIEMMEDRLRYPTLSMPPEEREAAWPTIVLRPESSRTFAQSVGIDLAAARAGQAGPGRPLPGLVVELNAQVEAVRTHADNILGLIPGSDPKLRDEVVIVSAHNDHIGTMKDGTVNNGADDNGSGTTTLMTAAAALAEQAPPRRTLLFLSVSGEEKGLLGSEWWCSHPTVPLDHVVADINIDMVGRNDPDAVGATPSPKHPDYNTLVTRAVELGPTVGLEITWNAPKAGEDTVDNYYQRSDHYNFASKGIPVVFFFSGVHEDYHRPTDDIEKIDREKLRKMVHLVMALATDVANSDERPHKVDGKAEPAAPVAPAAPAPEKKAG